MLSTQEQALKKRWCIFGAAATIAVVFGGLAISAPPPTSEHPAAPTTIVETIHPDGSIDRPNDRPPKTGLPVTITLLEWHKGGFGTVAIAGFRIDNGNSFAVKDIDVVCELTARSGTVMGYVSTTMYDVVPAHGSKSWFNVNMGSGVHVTGGLTQASDAWCKVGGMDRVTP